MEGYLKSKLENCVFTQPLTMLSAPGTAAHLVQHLRNKQMGCGLSKAPNHYKGPLLLHTPICKPSPSHMTEKCLDRYIQHVDFKRLETWLERERERERGRYRLSTRDTCFILWRQCLFLQARWWKQCRNPAADDSKFISDERCKKCWMIYGQQTSCSTNPECYTSMWKRTVTFH